MRRRPRVISHCFIIVDRADIVQVSSAALATAAPTHHLLPVLVRKDLLLEDSVQVAVVLQSLQVGGSLRRRLAQLDLVGAELAVDAALSLPSAASWLVEDV